MIYLKPLILSTLVVTATAMATNGNIRYMPFGDSITDDVCWRAKLWEKLQGTEFASVNFVGSSTHDRNCTDAKYDRNHEGHSGFLAVEIAKQNQLEGWLKANPADVITMHLGTNDIVHLTLTSDIIAAYTKLVATMRSSNPRMKIVVRSCSLIRRFISFTHLLSTGRTNPPHRARGSLQCTYSGIERCYSAMGKEFESDQEPDMGCGSVYGNCVERPEGWSSPERQRG